MPIRPVFGISRCDNCHRPHLGRCGPIVVEIDPILSYRQTQLVHLLCEGMSNLEMAEALGVSFQTIKKHMAEIFDVTGKESRLHLAMHYLGLMLNARIEQLEQQMNLDRANYETALARERSIVSRLEASLLREQRITDALVRGKGRAPNPPKSNSRMQHWLNPKKDSGRSSN